MIKIDNPRQYLIDIFGNIEDVVSKYLVIIDGVEYIREVNLAFFLKHMTPCIIEIDGPYEKETKPLPYPQRMRYWTIKLIEKKG